MGQTKTVTILGAGVIGLSLALKLHNDGFAVEIWEQGTPGMQASWAAAGMLAASDPHNPPDLAAFAAFSVGLYPTFLERLRAATGIEIPFQTEITVQIGADSSRRYLAEQSIDPRQLMQALVAGVASTRLPVRRVAADVHPESAFVIHTTGAWAQQFDVRPRKGQMMRVQLPHDQPLTEVYRSAHVYVVPRTAGAQAGTALLGATVEDCGFDTSVHSGDLERLRSHAAHLVPHLPALADAEKCPLVEAWAGLRPATADGLPLIGEIVSRQHGQRTFVATGHFRNGILLAPGTAALLTDLLQERKLPVDISPFAPSRPARTLEAGKAAIGHAKR